MSGTNISTPISVITIVDTFSPHLERALRSVEWVDEVILLDPHGNLTLPPDFALTTTLRLERVDGLDDFSAIRNQGNLLAKNDWVLHLDSDEWLHATNIADIVFSELQQVIHSGYSGLRFTRQDYFYGKLLKRGEILDQHHTRLVNRKAGAFQGRVHEQFVSTQPTQLSQASLLHTPHDNINDFITSANHYAQLLATDKQAAGFSTFQTPGWLWMWRLTAWPVGKALVNFFVKFGWRDGWVGVGYIVVMSFHSWLVRAYAYEQSQPAS